MSIPCNLGSVYGAGSGNRSGLLFLLLSGSGQDVRHTRGIARIQTDVYLIVRLKKVISY